jgi:opacity protein-like surface antigen
MKRKIVNKKIVSTALILSGVVLSGALNAAEVKYSVGAQLGGAFGSIGGDARNAFEEFGSKLPKSISGATYGVGVGAKITEGTFYLAPEFYLNYGKIYNKSLSKLKTIKDEEKVSALNSAQSEYNTKKLAYDEAYTNLADAIKEDAEVKRIEQDLDNATDLVSSTEDEYNTCKNKGSEADNCIDYDSTEFSSKEGIAYQNALAEKEALTDELNGRNSTNTEQAVSDLQSPFDEAEDLLGQGATLLSQAQAAEEAARTTDTYKTSLSIKSLYTAKVNIGYNINEQISVFGILGLGRYDVTVKYDVTEGGKNSKYEREYYTTAPIFGLGANYLLKDNIELRLSYTYSPVSVYEEKGNKKEEYKFGVNNLIAGVSYLF